MMRREQSQDNSRKEMRHVFGQIKSRPNFLVSDEEIYKFGFKQLSLSTVY